MELLVGLVHLDGTEALASAEPNRIKTINGRGSVDEVGSAIEAEVEQFLAGEGREESA